MNELFSEYIDGLLDDETRRALEEHLGACQSCAEDLRVLRSCISALGSLDRIEAPANFLEKVHERIALREQTSWLEWIKEKFFFPLLHVKLPLEMAGLAAAALLVVFIYHGAQQKTLPSYAPFRAEAPTEGGKSDPKSKAQSHEELALKSVPPAPARKAAPGTSAPKQSSTQIEEPLQLVLLIGQAKGSSMAFAEKDERTKAIDQPTGALDKASRSESKQEERSSKPLLGQEVSPAAPSVAGSGTNSSGMKANGGASPTKEAAKDLRAKRAKPAEPGPKAHSSPQDREAMDPLNALAEIRGFVQSAGGVVELIKYNEITSQPESLTVHIPARSFPQLLDRLHRMGRLRDPAQTLPQGAEIILVQITLESAP